MFLNQKTREISYDLLNAKKKELHDLVMDLYNKNVKSFHDTENDLTYILGDDDIHFKDSSESKDRILLRSDKYHINSQNYFGICIGTYKSSLKTIYWGGYSRGLGISHELTSVENAISLLNRYAKKSVQKEKKSNIEDKSEQEEKQSDQEEKQSDSTKSIRASIRRDLSKTLNSNIAEKMITACTEFAEDEDYGSDVSEAINDYGLDDLKEGKLYTSEFFKAKFHTTTQFTVHDVTVESINNYYTQ